MGLCVLSKLSARHSISTKKQNLVQWAIQMDFCSLTFHLRVLWLFRHSFAKVSSYIVSWIIKYYVFFYVGPPKKEIYLTTFYGLYFSSDFTCYKLPSESLRAASMYCIPPVLCDLWALLWLLSWYFIFPHMSHRTRSTMGIVTRLFSLWTIDAPHFDGIRST